MVGNTVNKVFNTGGVSQNISYKCVLSGERDAKVFWSIKFTICSFFVRVKMFYCEPVVGRKISEGLFWGSVKAFCRDGYHFGWTVYERVTFSEN